jgi:hypothetical protein
MLAAEKLERRIAQEISFAKDCRTRAAIMRKYLKWTGPLDPPAMFDQLAETSEKKAKLLKRWGSWIRATKKVRNGALG